MGSAAAAEDEAANVKQLKYKNLTEAVGFDVIAIARNAQTHGQAIKLDESIYQPFMDAAHELKQNLRGQNKTVHPLSLFLGAAMQMGNTDLISLGSRVLDSYGKNNRYITDVFGWHWGGREANKTELSLYQATGRLGSLGYRSLPQKSGGSVPNDQFKRLAPAYLIHTLNPSLQTYEGVFKLVQDNGVLKALFPSVLDKTTSLKELDANFINKIVEYLSKGNHNIPHSSSANILESLNHITDDCATALIANKPVSKELLDIMQRVPNNDYRLVSHLRERVTKKIKEALAAGAVITQPIPEFLQDVFERLAPTHVEHVLRSEYVNESIIKHVKTRAPWVVRGTTVHGQAVIEALRRMASEYDVFDQNLLRTYQNGSQVKPFVVIPIDLFRNNKDTIRLIFDANPNSTLVVDYKTATKADGLAFVGRAALPESVHHISFIGANVTSIEGYFLSRCNGLISVDLSGFSKVHSIGGGFLLGCGKLASVGLSNALEPGKSTMGNALRSAKYSGAILA